MAIPLFTKTFRTDGTASPTIQFDDWFTDEQQVSGDYLMLAAMNDNGAVVLSIDGGWNKLGGVDAPSNGGCRMSVFWIKCTGTPIPAPTITGANFAWAATAFIVRDAPDVADETWIDGYVRTDQTTSITLPLFPAITTTEDNCTILRIAGVDSGSWLFPVNAFFEGTVLNAGTDNATTATPSLTQLITSNLAPVTGVVTAEQMERNISDGGTFYSIAIKNKVGGALPAKVSDGGAVVRADNNVRVSPTITNADTVITTIEGNTVLTPTSVGSGAVQQGTTIEIGYYRTLATTAPSSVGVFGRLVSLKAPTDMSDGKLVVITASHSNYAQLSPKGLYWVFMDTLGNWNAYRFQGKAAGLTFKTIILNLADETIADSSPTPADLTDIDRWGGLFYNIIAIAASKTFNYRSLFTIDTTKPAIIVTGGSAGNPVNPLTIARAMDSTVLYNTVGIQGGVQILSQLPVQIGDGASPTYFRGEGFSYVYPLIGGIETYRVGDGLQTLSIKTGPSDVVDMSAMTIASEYQYNFLMDAASDTAATYIAPSVIRGFGYTPKFGLPTVGSTITRCPKIIGGGATFDSCTFKRTSATDAALRLSSGGEALSCQFQSNGEDYAIELLDAGTYDITDAEFTGYTNDLHILASSGTVTITLATGQAQPTYVSDGATVVWDQAVAGTTWTNEDLADGTTVLVRNVTTSTTIVFVASLSTGTGYTISLVPSVDYTVGDVLEVYQSRKNGTTYYIERTSRIITTGEGGSIVEADALTVCPICTGFGLDGAGATINDKFELDFIDDDLDFDVTGNWQVAEAMVFFKTQMTTQSGIESFWGAWTVQSDGSFRNDATILPSLLDTTITGDCVETTGRRLFRSDDVRPVRSPTTGGGAIDVSWREPVTVVATGSGVLPADITAIADAVWDEELASHLAVGSAGEALDGAGGGGGATAEAIRIEIDSNSTKLASIASAIEDVSDLVAGS